MKDGDLLINLSHSSFMISIYVFIMEPHGIKLKGRGPQIDRGF